MMHVFNEYGFEYEIVVENGSRFLTSAERATIKNILFNEKIGFGCIELRSGPQASLFHGIAVFLNENLTSLLIGGLLMPSAYDVLKLAIKKIICSLKNGLVRILSGNKISLPILILKLSTGKGRIEAPIPQNLTDAQFDKYMDLLKSSIQSISESELDDKHLIAEYDSEQERVNIETILEYGRRQWEKQQKKQSDFENEVY